MKLKFLESVFALIWRERERDREKGKLQEDSTCSGLPAVKEALMMEENLILKEVPMKYRRRESIGIRNFEFKDWKREKRERERDRKEKKGKGGKNEEEIGRRDSYHAFE